MAGSSSNPVHQYAPTVLMIIFAILQGLTVYFTKNVETRISQLDEKLDKTWETAIVTKTELATVKAQAKASQAEIDKLEKELDDTREQFLRHVAESPH